MPTYDYTCDTCQHTWEEFQSMSAAPSTVCPECGKPTARRLIGSGAGLIFKGGGFYCTDYRAKSGGDGASTSDKSAAPATSSPATPAAG